MAKPAVLRVTPTERRELRAYLRKRNLPASVAQRMPIVLLLDQGTPQFEQKAAAIIGLYLHPPQSAAVFCVDEKSAIQALDRLDRRSSSCA